MNGSTKVTFARRAATSGPALAALLALACLGGCFFEPRSADPPAQSVTYIPAQEAKAVLENLDTALHARDATGYMNMIGDAFTYVPDSQARSDYPAVDWDHWDRAKEYSFINAFCNSSNVTGVTPALRDSTVFADTPSGTKVIWEFIYDIKSTGAGRTTEFRGRAFLTLELVSNFWKLTKWEDEHGEAPRGGGGTLQTSGDLRGAFSNGGG